MKKIIFSTIALVLMFFVFSTAGATNTSTSTSESNLVYSDSIDITTVRNNDGSLKISWTPYTQNESFSYYKVVRSQTNQNPVYPDDGYIFYSSDKNVVTYVDKEVPAGVSYYRVCHVTSSQRICSKEVIKIDNSEKQVICTTEYKPVCGFDGKTYSNECVASGAGVKVISDGECKISSSKQVDCTDLESGCSVKIEDSFIINLKENASTGYQWVLDYDKEKVKFVDKTSKSSCTGLMVGCGSDVTYSFIPLKAGATNISLKYMRVWESVQPAETKNYVINITTEKQEIVCYNIYNPVCGKDGKTYDNDCRAKAAGTEVNYEGSCKSSTIPENMTREELIKLIINLLQALLSKGSSL